MDEETWTRVANVDRANISSDEANDAFHDLQTLMRAAKRAGAAMEKAVLARAADKERVLAFLVDYGSAQNGMRENKVVAIASWLLSAHEWRSVAGGGLRIRLAQLHESLAEVLDEDASVADGSAWNWEVVDVSSTNEELALGAEVDQRALTNISCSKSVVSAVAIIILCVASAWCLSLGPLFGLEASRHAVAGGQRPHHNSNFFRGRVPLPSTTRNAPAKSKRRVLLPPTARKTSAIVSNVCSNITKAFTAVVVGHTGFGKSTLLDMIAGGVEIAKASSGGKAETQKTTCYITD